MRFAQNSMCLRFVWQTVNLFRAETERYLAICFHAVFVVVFFLRPVTTTSTMWKFNYNSSLKVNRKSVKCSSFELYIALNVLMLLRLKQYEFRQINHQLVAPHQISLILIPLLFNSFHSHLQSHWNFPAACSHSISILSMVVLAAIRHNELFIRATMLSLFINRKIIYTRNINTMVQCCSPRAYQVEHWVWVSVCVYVCIKRATIQSSKTHNSFGN